MVKRMVIPVEDEAGLNAYVAQHFGRAPYFAVVDLDDDNSILDVKTEKNISEHVGGLGLPHENLLVLKPDFFVVYGMGLGCLRSIQNTGIKVLKATGDTVNKIISNFKEGKLGSLENGCDHSHH